MILQLLTTISVILLGCICFETIRKIITKYDRHARWDISSDFPGVYSQRLQRIVQSNESQSRLSRDESTRDLLGRSGSYTAPTTTGGTGHQRQGRTADRIQDERLGQSVEGPIRHRRITGASDNPDKTHMLHMIPKAVDHRDDRSSLRKGSLDMARSVLPSSKRVGSVSAEPRKKRAITAVGITGDQPPVLRAKKNSERRNPKRNKRSLKLLFVADEDADWMEVDGKLAMMWKPNKLEDDERPAKRNRVGQSPSMKMESRKRKKGDDSVPVRFEKPSGSVNRVDHFVHDPKSTFRPAHTEIYSLRKSIPSPRRGEHKLLSIISLICSSADSHSRDRRRSISFGAVPISRGEILSTSPRPSQPRSQTSGAVQSPHRYIQRNLRFPEPSTIKKARRYKLSTDIGLKSKLVEEKSRADERVASFLIEISTKKNTEPEKPKIRGSAGPDTTSSSNNVVPELSFGKVESSDQKTSVSAAATTTTTSSSAPAPVAPSSAAPSYTAPQFTFGQATAGDSSTTANQSSTPGDAISKPTVGSFQFGASVDPSSSSSATFTFGGGGRGDKSVPSGFTFGASSGAGGDKSIPSGFTFGAPGGAGPAIPPHPTLSSPFQAAPALPSLGPANPGSDAGGFSLGIAAGASQGARRNVRARRPRR